MVKLLQATLSSNAVPPGPAASAAPVETVNDLLAATGMSWPRRVVLRAVVGLTRAGPHPPLKLTLTRTLTLHPHPRRAPA